MLATIEFNNQPCVSADEVDDIAENWHLPTELPAAQLAISQSRPQERLGTCLVATKSTGNAMVGHEA